MYWCLLFAFLCVSYSDQRSTPEDDSYTAAVVEYQVFDDTAVNLQNYVTLIRDAGAQGADIVVFPELTLARGRSVVIPMNSTLREYPIPALEPERYDEILVTISAAARQSQIYVLINVEEIVNCIGNTDQEFCPEFKLYLFNTNVVFDRNGTIIDRYRKINLFGEFTRTPALRSDLGIFETDFGVTFGHYICFDLMFQVPSVQVVQQYNVTDIVFTTMWFSEMPYLTASEIQQGYAQAMNVNFLAAGANNVAVGSGGSGIYSGRAGALISIMPGRSTTRLLVAKVPKVPGQITETYPGPIYDSPTVKDNLLLISDPSLSAHVTRLLRYEQQEFTLTDRDVACTFRVNLRRRDGETGPFYRAFVHDGENVYAKRPLGTLGCVVVACRTEDPKSCDYRFNNNEENVIIEQLEIKMTSYRKRYNETFQCDDIVYYPLSLRNNKYPLTSQNFTFDVIEDDFSEDNVIQPNSKRERMKYEITSPQQELIAFGIWGRVFNRDVKVEHNPTKEDIRRYYEMENIIYNPEQQKKINP